MKTLLMLVVLLCLSACHDDTYDQLTLNGRYCMSEQECDRAFNESAEFARDHLCKSHDRDEKSVPIPGFDNHYDCADFSII